MATDIPWTQIKAMSFDIYGTLIDWETGIDSAARATCIGPYLPPSRAEFLADMERHEKALHKQHPTWKQSEIIAEDLRRYATHDLRLVADGKLSADQVEDAARRYAEALGAYPAFEDTVAAIRSLQKRYKLVPLSNVDRASFQRTLEGPLKGCEFAAIYTAEDIGSYKPDPRNFEYLIKHLKHDFGVGVEELCHTAQSLFHDHEPAKKAGLPYTVWVDRKGVMGQVGGDEPKGEEVGFKLKVNTLGELAEIVEQAFAKP